MAKKKIQEKPKTLCADCARLKINESNRNWEGKAFTGHCNADGKLKILNMDGCGINFKKKI